jgi:uncharacterized membrane protein required for colicin V production
MTFWLLALVLLGSCALMGLRQGIARVAISFVGILVAALLAAPMGSLIRPIVTSVWTKDPLLVWAVPPLIMFFVVSLLFKALAVLPHKKLEMHQKYNAGELRMALWERLDHRLGLCMGLLNGAAYLVLLSFVIFAGSYWTTQVATSSEDPKIFRLLNALGKGMESSGFTKVARAVDQLPDHYYQAADIVGLVYANPLVEARMGSYPGFLSLAERGEFQQLSGDAEFIRMRQEKKPIQKVLGHPQAQVILKSPELMKVIWDKLDSDGKDLVAYLSTGISGKYGSELILGRWNFNVNAALADFLKAKPNVTAKEMQKAKNAIIAAFGKAKFLATTEGQAIVKNAPPWGTPLGASAALQSIQGTWKALGASKYDLNFADAGNITAVAEMDRLIITGAGISMIFNRAD